VQSLLAPVGAIADEQVFLIGRPPMSEFLGYIATQTVEGQSIPQGALANVWRSANDRILQLERDESGWADSPTVDLLTKELNALRDKVLADPIVQRTFAVVPFEIGIVELDRMVVYQKHINLTYVNELKQLLGATPTDEEAFAFCLPVDRRYDPQVHVGRIGPNAWSFSSPSTDLRMLDFVLVDPSAISGLEMTGAAVAVAGVAVGYGSNYLSALRVENRLILNNGSHRAYTLRSLGVTHAPCLIQNITRPEELELIATVDVQERSELFLKHPRPPVLRDYFDDDLRMVVHVPRKNRQIRIAVQVEQLDVPAG
jgi:hypothetical protein